jgi:hypothetical protein
MFLFHRDASYLGRHSDPELVEGEEPLFFVFVFSQSDLSVQIRSDSRLNNFQATNAPISPKIACQALHGLSKGPFHPLTKTKARTCLAENILAEVGILVSPNPLE